MEELNTKDLFDGGGEKMPDHKNEDLEKLLKKSHIHVTQNIGKPPSIMKIRDNENYIDIMTAGNISMIKGAAKSRKSFSCTFLTAAAAARKEIQFKFLPQMKKKGVVIVDTEQSDYHVHRNLKTVVNLIGYGGQPDHLRAFALRKYDTATRLALVEWIIYNLPEIGLLIIDGIRDLVLDINSQEEAKMITDKELKWTAETGIHILNILHENKEGGKARGHLGTELMNKCETVFQVKKCEEKNNEHISIIADEGTRGQGFNDIGFYIDNTEQGIIPVICPIEFADKF